MNTALISKPSAYYKQCRGNSRARHLWGVQNGLTFDLLTPSFAWPTKLWGLISNFLYWDWDKVLIGFWDLGWGHFGMNWWSYVKKGIKHTYICIFFYSIIQKTRDKIFIKEGAHYITSPLCFGGHESPHYPIFGLQIASSHRKDFFQDLHIEK